MTELKELQLKCEHFNLRQDNDEKDENGNFVNNTPEDFTDDKFYKNGKYPFHRKENK